MASISIDYGQMSQIEAVSVSVVIPSFNSAATISKCLLSAASQSLRPKEIIVVDDQSTDSTSEVIRNLIIQDESLPIILIQKDNNEGPGSARNDGIKAATGKLIAFLDADDFWLPDHLMTAVAILMSVEIDSTVVVHRPLGVGKDDPPMSVPSFRFFAPIEFMFVQSFSSVITLVAARELIMRSGLFPVSRKHAEDFEFALRLFLGAKHCCTVLSPRTAVIGKHAFASGSGLSSQKWPMLWGSLRALRNVLSSSTYSPLLPVLWIWTILKFVRREMLS